MALANYTSFMDAALALAKAALTVGEVPVGAVVIQNGKIIGRGHNRTRIDHDPTAHAEIVAIREATGFLDNDRLDDCDLWVTLEPCTMCAGAIAHARIRRLYYGAGDAKGGAVDSGVRFFDAPTCHHKPEVYAGMGEDISAKLLTDFFRGRRD
ncbi:tRNA adenosine(34) deaminase TadA [uncultured Parasphingorhabdus sp.]|uniref:tRNA adenosine(34) deaminase TadA n=1 Tax=uncultured Parasphingorhabdus sp. TaxID=2709694 RepID=UPI0030D92EEE|tara:strand:+ start:12906 stop:13364 length:459 start_codon:yes stop_codon:yes gene_type:complete